jgi:Dolichyl-phosphate-mannose-protein mannosyltransferase
MPPRDHLNLATTSTDIPSRLPEADERIPSGSVLARLKSIAVSRELVWSVVLVGVAVRVWHYAANPSFWLDESFLGLNIIDRSMHRLLVYPLDMNQTAPAGFLFIEKLVSDVFGKGEYALRSFPLLFGISSVALYAALARRVLTPVGAVIAVALLAFAGPLVYYSTELKPYAGDVAATIALSLIGLAILRSRLSVGRVVAFGLIGFVLIQVTYAGILAAAGTAGALMLIFAADRRWNRFASVTVLAGIWALGAAVFLFSHVGVEHGQYMQGRYGRFAPLPSSYSAFTWYFRRTTDIAAEANLYNNFRTPLVAVSLLAACLALVGAANLAVRRWRVFTILVAPEIVTLGASAAHQYPLLARAMLFFVPLLFLLIVNGIAVLARNLPSPLGAAAAPVIAVVLLLHVTFEGGLNATKAYGARPEIKESLSYVARHWRRGDVLYVHYGSQYAFAYYSECSCFRLPGNRKLGSLWPVRRTALTDPARQLPTVLIAKRSSIMIGTRRPVRNPGPSFVYAHDASRLARHPRAWILVTWLFGSRELRLIRGELLVSLDRRGRRVASLYQHGSRLYLYEFPRR